MIVSSELQRPGASTVSPVIAKRSFWRRWVAFLLGLAVVWPAHSASITASGSVLTQAGGSSTCNYSQATESVPGDWNFTCGTGPATVTISPAVNGTVCVSYGAMSEDVNGNWTITGCASASPTVSLDAPVPSSSTYPSNVPFTLKATATPPAGRTISSVEFFHDGVSIHTGTLSGTQYVWDWGPPTGTYEVTARATDNTGATTETSPAVQMIFAPAVGPATIYYIHPDQLGTPREITRASDNQIVWRWDNTEAFGNTQPDENPSGLGTFDYNPRFPGQYYDAETATNYNYFRDYDPTVGRYIESDPVGLAAGVNTYGYVGGNPLSYFDPRGKNPLAGCLAGAWGGPIGCGVGAAIGTIAMIGATAIIASAIGSDSEHDVVRDQQPFFPGKNCDGSCKPCPPTIKWDAEGDAHGSTGGRHWHGIEWNQNPQTCWCYPRRLSGPTQNDLR